MDHATIAGIATALSESGISIIRVSGEDAISYVDQIFSSKRGIRLTDVASHTIHYGTIMDRNMMLDEVLVSVMRAPHTYTTEDVVEINCHGGPLITQKILKLLISLGVQIAEPGEFTKRAFLGGRIDLSEAEAVMDLISAKNDFALKNSAAQLSGAVYRKIKAFREKILYQMAYIESALDDPENYDLTGFPDQLHDLLETLSAELSLFIESADHGKILKDGISTCILGKPNAGKSSFLNTLVGCDKAIVTDIAGTTRDALEETIQMGNFSLHLIDTAGIRDTEDVIEQMGVEKATAFAKDADLIIYMVDSSVPLDESDRQIISLIGKTPCIVLLNKSDLSQAVSKEEIASLLPIPSSQILPFSTVASFTSEQKELSIDACIAQLKELIDEMFFSGKLSSYNDEVVITNLRQKNHLINAAKSIDLVQESIAQGLSEDFYSIDLMNAYAELGFIIGEEVEDDLVNEIFSKFCMGK